MLIESEPMPGARLLGAFVVAWLVGYTVPGAPGGLGLRQAVLGLLLTPSVGEPAALIWAAGFRLVSVLGDVLSYLIGVALGRTVDPV